MSTITKDEFLRCLKSSRVINEDQLNAFLSSVNSEDPKELARQAVAQDLLTRWQAKYLMSGRHLLHIGNYRLIERIQRDELGDRFLAVHLQLDRKVEIQLLPYQLSQHNQRRDTFIQKASAAATIDHPNLIHVYDIDQEGGRLFLVTEHVAGQTLASYPVAQLSDVDIARIVKQVLSGALEAHKAGLVHGQLNRDNILITNGELVKVQNLAISSLAQFAVPVKPNDDINQIGKLGVQLLAQVDRSAGPKAKKKLFDLLSWLGTTDDAGFGKVITKLDEWINEHNDNTQNTILSQQAARQREANQGGREQMASSSPASRVATPPTKPAHSSPPPQLPTNPVSTTTLIGTIVLGGVLLIGGIGWFAYSMTRSSEETANKAGTEKKTNPSSPSNRKLQAQSNRSITPTTKERKSSSLADAASPEIDSMLQEGHDQSPDRTPLANVDHAAPPPADDGQELSQTAMPPDSDATATTLAFNTSDSNPVSEVKSGAAATDTDKSPGSVPPSKSANGKRDVSQPYKDFPTAVALPQIDNVGRHSIGPIYCPDNYLLLAELVAGKEICKSRITFSMNRDQNDKQRWIVRFKRRKTDEPIEIATIQREGDEIYHQWLPAAQDSEAVEYFRNCLLKFTAKDAVQFLHLRKPIEISGFSLSEDRLERKLETELAWLPAPESLVIELQPFKYDELTAVLANRTVLRKHPGLIYFSEKASQRFVWLEVTADARKKLRLNATLKMQTAPNSRPVRVSLDVLTAMNARIKQEADSASFQYSRMTDETKPESMTWTDFNKQKKNLKEYSEDAQKLASDTIELQNKLSSLFDKQIPVVVFFEMEGVRTILAESKVTE